MRSLLLIYMALLYFCVPLCVGFSHSFELVIVVSNTTELINSVLVEGAPLGLVFCYICISGRHNACCFTSNVTHLPTFCLSLGAASFVIPIFSGGHFSSQLHFADRWLFVAVAVTAFLLCHNCIFCLRSVVEASGAVRLTILYVYCSLSHANKTVVPVCMVH